MQVAGASVSLGAVRAVLEADPRVVAAEVVGLPDPDWGCRLVAAVVPANAAGAPSEGGPHPGTRTVGARSEQDPERAQARVPTNSGTSWSRRSDAPPVPGHPPGGRPPDAWSRGRSIAWPCWRGPATSTGSPDDHLRQWIAGARPRTLPAALAPVLVGTAVAMWDGGAVWDRALLALVVALALQVGVNYANDYSDGIRGTDAERVGPGAPGRARAWPSPRAVKRAALLSFAVAGVAGLALVVLSGLWWLLLVGAAAIVAAWTYTGGPRPYGYAGLGRGVRLRVLRPGRRRAARRAVQVGFVSALAWLCGVGVGRAVVRDPRGQQPARHPRATPWPASAPWRYGSVTRPTRRLYASTRRSGLAVPAVLAGPGLRGPRVLARGRAARARCRPAGDPAARDRPRLGATRAGAGPRSCRDRSAPAGLRRPAGAGIAIGALTQLKPVREVARSSPIGWRRSGRPGRALDRRSRAGSRPATHTRSRVACDEPAPGGPDAAVQPRHLRPDVPRRPESRRDEGPGGLLRGQGPGRDEGRVPRGHLVQGLPGLHRRAAACSPESPRRPTSAPCCDGSRQSPAGTPRGSTSSTRSSASTPWPTGTPGRSASWAWGRCGLSANDGARKAQVGEAAGAEGGIFGVRPVRDAPTARTSTPPT